MKRKPATPPIWGHFSLIGPLMQPEENSYRENNRPYGNAYVYETCRFISAWSLITDQPECSVAVLAGRALISHPALLGATVSEEFKLPHRDGFDDYTTAIVALIGGSRDKAGFMGVSPNARIIVSDVIANNLMGLLSDAVAALSGLVTPSGIRAKVIYLPFFWGPRNDFPPGHPGCASNPNHPFRILMRTAIRAGACIVSPVGITEGQESYPAAFPECISVCALGRDDKKMPGSGFGEWVTVAAPGEDIWVCDTKGRYVLASGPHLAGAFVAGTLALMYSVHPALRPDDAKNILRLTADPIDHLNAEFAGKLGAGRINAYKAVLAALNARTGPAGETNDPPTTSRESIIGDRRSSDRFANRFRRIHLGENAGS